MANQLMFRAVLSLAVLGLACGRGAEADSAEDADESVSVTSSESALTSELADEASQPMSMTAEQIGSAAATRIASRFTPQGCATSTQSGATVTYTLTNCTGPYGLVKVTGVLTAVYSRVATGVQVVITGTGIKANNVTFDINSTVLGSITNGVKKAEVSTNSDGSGPRGAALNRTGNYVVTFDPATECATLNGTWETKVGLRKASTVVTGYARCKGTCPASGGTIAHTTTGGVTVTLTYDGSAAAKWATSGGRSGTVNLMCTPKA